MGQYYKILNVDKKEMLVPWSFDNGAKLMEWSYQRNDMVIALENLVKAGGRWAGDRVLVCGDYAEASEDVPEENKDIWDSVYIQAAKDLGFYGKKETSEDGRHEYSVNLYGYASDNFTELLPKDLNLKASGNRYVINHAKKVFIDNKHCPIEWVWCDEKKKKAGVGKIAPISLLLAMGNGQGGGDYYRNVNSSNANTIDMVGSWAVDAGQIEVAGTKPKGYTEFTPNFSENEHLIPWDSEKGLIAEKLNSLR